MALMAWFAHLCGRRRRLLFRFLAPISPELVLKAIAQEQLQSSRWFQGGKHQCSTLSHLCVTSSIFTSTSNWVLFLVLSKGVKGLWESKFKSFTKALSAQNASADLQEVCLLLKHKKPPNFHRITMNGCLLACSEPPPLPRRERDLSSKRFGYHWSTWQPKKIDFIL